MIELNKKVAQCDTDDLIAGTQPPCHTGGGFLAANSGDLSRGTILAINADRVLEPLGKTEGAKAYGILTDDTADSTEETPVTVYLSGKFNSNKVSTAEGYTITNEDLDTLRTYGIELTAAMKY